ncbi:MAG: hydrogenase maturation protease [Candidatus Korobacteraceae bacterium]
MKDHVLVAGVGNIFLGDDAFGVEVAQAMTARALPEQVVVRDFGIRSFDLAYALLDDWIAVILVDAVSRNAAPGTLFVIEPDLRELAEATETAAFDGHSMDPVSVLRLAQTLGEIQPKVLVVGCEPADLGGEEGRMGLSPEVEGAVGETVCMVEKLAQDLLAKAAAPATA